MLIFSSLGIHAQVDQPKDTLGYNKGKVIIGNPPTIVESYTYDPITDQYIYTNTVSGYNINYPLILSPAEYRKRVLKESMRDYFRSKNSGFRGEKEKFITKILCKFWDLFDHFWK
jgi:cell surface protein SprA